MLHDITIAAKGYIKSIFKREPSCAEDYPIDFVVTWVDGNDPNWQKERAEFFGENYFPGGNSMCRYRDWITFKYWFRAVEKYAPWVRYVFLVTWGHVPEWLNTKCEKLRIISHKEFIPLHELPTYNSNTIEFNLFRIKELSEHFVYFNDDVLLTRPVSREEFFLNGKPRHTGIAKPWINRDNHMAYHINFNVYGLVNRENNIRKAIESYPEKWFSYRYGLAARHNLDAMREEGLPGMFFTHMSVPLMKSSMERTYLKYKKECDESNVYKLRDKNQLVHQLFSIEDILAGNFVPCAAYWGTIVNIDDYSGIKKCFSDNKKKMVCFCDRGDITEAEEKEINFRVDEILNEFFRDKSSFEY